jgi:hypothetical protein
MFLVYTSKHGSVYSDTIEGAKEIWKKDLPWEPMPKKFPKATITLDENEILLLDNPPEEMTVKAEVVIPAGDRCGSPCLFFQLNQYNSPECRKFHTQLKVRGAMPLKCAECIKEFGIK